jgi:uncharacterized membrane protein YraQ (UPF0718 family)
MLETFWSLLRESATFLLAGLLVASVLDAALAGGWLVKRLAARRRSSVLLATVVGLPLPLCSCSVLPSALALRSRGASRGATLSFLISTPETSVTSILLTYGLLGPVMAVVRPVAACITAIVAGLVEDARDTENEPQATDATHAPHGTHATPAYSDDTGQAAACCDDSRADTPVGLGARSLAGLRYAFGDLLDDIFGWVVAGVLAAAAITTWVPPETMAAAFGDSWLAMPLMVLIGVPLYICAEASTPLAAALVAQGVSPGAALVLLLVGPATNLGAVGVLRKALGGRTVAIYLGTIIAVALSSGVALDAWIGTEPMVLGLPDLHQPLLPATLENIAAVLFLTLGITRLVRRLGSS